MPRACLALALASVLAACQPATTRPTFTPFPEDVILVLHLPVDRATRAITDALLDDSIPVARSVPRDGYVETPWFDAATLRPVHGRGFGPGHVRIRAWIDPTRPRESEARMEAVYRPKVDPSLPERELEATLPAGHPVAVRLAAIIRTLLEAHGELPPAAGT